jgi:hypothetical protein
MSEDLDAPRRRLAERRKRMIDIEQRAAEPMVAVALLSAATLYSGKPVTASDVLRTAKEFHGWAIERAREVAHAVVRQIPDEEL